MRLSFPHLLLVWSGHVESTKQLQICKVCTNTVELALYIYCRLTVNSMVSEGASSSMQIKCVLIYRECRLVSPWCEVRPLLLCRCGV